MKILIRIFYNIIFVPLASLRLLYKIYNDKNYKNYALERFGFYTPPKSSIYIHVVSLGEFNAALPLIRALNTNYSNHKIFITCTTPTGRQAIEKAFNIHSDIKYAYIPYDNFYLSKNFVKKLQPKIALIFEKELWPELFSALKKYNTSIFLVNAALSERSFKKYKHFPKILENLLKKVDYIGTQTQDDLNNFKNLGAKEEQISVLGNIKFALELPNDLNSRLSNNLYFKKPSKITIIAASTHQNEEDIILRAFVNLKKFYPFLNLIIAPRHPERFNKVVKIIENYNLSYSKFSENLGNNNKVDTDVFLLDTLGELLYFYNIADIAIVCGSFVRDIGCHNILEPAALGMPIIVGNFFHNYTRLITEFFNNKALIISNEENLTKDLQNLLQNETQRTKLSHNALKMYQAGSGALTKTLNIIHEYL